VAFSFRHAEDGADAEWQAGPVVPAVDGTALWHPFSATRAGLWQVKAEVDGVLLGAAVTVLFEAGPPDLSKMKGSLAGTAGVIAADGVTRHRLSVAVVDSFGNPVPGQAVRFELTGVAGVAGASLVDLAEGTPLGGEALIGSSLVGAAGIGVVSDRVGTVTVSAWSDSELLGQVAFTFGPEAPSVETSTLELESATDASRKLVYTATVTVRDGDGDVVPGTEVEFELADGLLLSGSGPFSAGPDGRVSVVVAASRAGAFELEAWLGANLIGSKAVALVFPAVLDLESSAALEPAGAGMADRRAPVEVVARLVDQYGDRLADGVVGFRVDAAGLFASDVASPCFVTVPVDQDSGEARLLVEAVSAGAYQVAVSASFDGEWVDLPGSPVTVEFTHPPPDPGDDPGDDPDDDPGDGPAAAIQLTPTDGAVLSGVVNGIGGGTVVVTGTDGTELCRVEMGSNGAWSCELEPIASEGDVLRIEHTDQSRVVSEVSWRVGVPRLVLGSDPVRVGASQSVVAVNFQPGEEVTAVMRSDPVQLGRAVAGADGGLSFTWVVPADVPAGSHTVQLTGAMSGQFSAVFEVMATEAGPSPSPNPSSAVRGLPLTGSTAGLLTLASGALLLVGGSVLAWSRRCAARSTAPLQ
jgi:hypothetical protein